MSAADFVVWRHTLGNSVARGTGADADFDGLVTRADLELWRANFGQAAGSGQSIQGDLAVPEPGPAVLVAVLAVIAVVGRVRLATAFQ